MSMASDIKPFLRWAGGKRWLAKSLASILAKRLGNGSRYFEPFLGSGAMFFSIKPQKAILSDLNEQLIVTFAQVATQSHDLIKRLLALPATQSYYDQVRAWSPRTDLNLAARFIYLNRNCYGGLYRENMQGIFNVPYGGRGRNHKRICTDDTILRASSVLNHSGIRITSCDFQVAFRQARNGDVIYCDPTYRPVTRKHFDRYGKIIFDWEDQERLAREALDAYSRGVLVIISNASCNGIKNLYSQAGVIKMVRRKGLGLKKDFHGLVEYLFILDPLHRWEEWHQIGLPIELPKKRISCSTSKSVSLYYARSDRQNDALFKLLNEA